MVQFAGYNLWWSVATIAGNADVSEDLEAYANDSYEKYLTRRLNLGDATGGPNFFQLQQTRGQLLFAVEHAVDWRFMIFNLYRRGRAA